MTNADNAVQSTVTAPSRWTELDGQRRSLVRRWESYSIYTIPYICPDENYQQDTDEMTHDFQAVGAQAVNSLANKIMLALFAPSRPFFKLDPDDETKEELMKVGIDPDALKDVFSSLELQSAKLLDTKNFRPVMFEIIKSLIVTGNSLMDLGSEVAYVRVRDFVVKRDYYGRPCEIMIKTCLKFEQLTIDVQESCKQKKPNGYTPDTKVDVYRWYKVDETGKRMKMTYWIDDLSLEDGKYQGDWKREDCPVRPLTWCLTANADYGTGLVEEYAGDFAALSTMSTSFVQGSVLASEFRWLSNPAGMTQPEDVRDSNNGAVIPGVAGDLSLISAGQGMGQTLQMMMNGMDIYTRRISQGFLMMSGVTRDAERVTAEEIRMQANELENSLGGAYSRLAIDMQLPIANWLLDMQDLSIKGVKMNVSIVTGLNALSRNGDLDNLNAAVGNITAMYQMPPLAMRLLKMDAVISDIMAGHGLLATRYVKTQAEVAQEEQQAQQQALAQQGAANVVDQATMPQQPM